jgi:hypothetical protein
MRQEQINRLIGMIWILISPIIWIMAVISKIESDTEYQIQLVCFSIIAGLGLLAGIASLIKSVWANTVLKYLSWMVFVFFTCSSVAMLFQGIMLVIDGNFGAAAFMFPIALGVVATGLPFFVMARKLSGKTIF